MRSVREGTHPEGFAPEGGKSRRTFWWDRARPIDADLGPLRAVIFDLDGAIADIERDGHRMAFNAAFAAHGLEVVWDTAEYGQLLKIGDSQRRIAASLLRRGFGPAADQLAAEVHSTKTEWYEDCVLDNVVEPRPGLIDTVMSLFVAGVWVGVVSDGPREMAQGLVRQLVGDGLVETIVSADDVTLPARGAEFYELALWEFGITPDAALAVVGGAAGLRTAAEAGLATAVVPTGYTADQDFAGAAAVLPCYDGAEPLLAPGCQDLHRRWWAARKRAARKRATLLRACPWPL
jgi:beta-phosphoglucomutase-like phosphatase (HAD superfamily)